MTRRITLLALTLFLAFARNTQAQIAAADLQIQGVGLRVVDRAVSTGLDIPSFVQTEFGGRQNDEAPHVEDLLAAGELTGPGIDTPIRLETAPGHKFEIPALSREGVYFLQNIRLMKGREFLQEATPSIVAITVSNLLQTTLRVRQLSPEELRARGIPVDGRNYEVYEYTFSFIVNGEVVEIPFPVIIDPRTHEVRQYTPEQEYNLPPVGQVTPPRWSPPGVVPFELGPGGEFPVQKQDPERGAKRPSIPAALVIPNELAVLHQFFAVALVVTNGAPDGSQVVLDSVTALFKPPATLRTVKSTPAIPFNQPVPIVDASTGATFLIAQAKGEAEWVMEGLRPGTHKIDVEVRATYKSPGQPDFPLKGLASTSVIVHDPRFNITFSHPDTVRKDEPYSTFSFITNMTAVSQTIRAGNEVPSCEEAPNANVCRLPGTPEFHEMTLGPGDTQTVEYRLKPNITGHVFATAGEVSPNISAAVVLRMGVSESGIPLSPATLVMPHYAKYVDQDLVSANLHLLGLGYSLATAPLTPSLAKHPRVIRTDVFRRAVDIARAGQRMFLFEDAADSYAHMALDLLGNDVELREWDELRRKEKSGRRAGAAVTRVLETGVTSETIDDFVANFASATAWRQPYASILVHGPPASEPRPYALSLTGLSGRKLDIPNEAESGWIRNLPFADLSRFAPDANSTGELALVGRWTEDFTATITPAVSGPLAVELILPATETGSVLRAHLELAGVAGQPLTIALQKGLDTITVLDASGGIAMTANATSVAAEPLRAIAARQDLHLDDNGHRVSVLFSRPIEMTTGPDDDIVDKFSARAHVAKDGIDVRANRPIPGAALQEGGRIVNVNFDHALSVNAEYEMDITTFLDPLTKQPVTFGRVPQFKIDNDKPGAILYGQVLQGNNEPLFNADVRLYAHGAPQYDYSSREDGSYLFEYVPRDVDENISGQYRLEAVTDAATPAERKQTYVEGAVRLPGRVHRVNLVFLGRGSAEGFVKYTTGEKVANASVTIGSTMFNQFRSTQTDANGFYHVDDLPVGPLTFSAQDADGNVTYAAAELKTPGQLVTQDLNIFRQPFPGTGSIRVVVKRSDTSGPVAGARVGVFSQGYGLQEGLSDEQGRYEFTKVPAGFITVLAAEWNVSLESAAVDFDLTADQTRDVTLTLNVTPPDQLVPIHGQVIRENPLFPGDQSRYEPVAGALVKVEKGPIVVADENGNYSYQAIPVSWGGNKNLQAYDPSTSRSASAQIPQLNASGENVVNIFIRTSDGFGTGDIRVRLLDAAGNPVNGYRVIEKGIPTPLVYPMEAPGVYVRRGVPVGPTFEVWAVPPGSNGPYGDQFVSGSTKVEFNGHTAALTLRLPGQGIVRAQLKQGEFKVIGDVKLSYSVWDEAEQEPGPKEVTVSTNVNGEADFAVFNKVPANQPIVIASAHPTYGHAAEDAKLAFDGDVQSVTLLLSRLSSVSGTVYEIDGRTPVPGASVRLRNDRVDYGIVTSKPDGTFIFKNVPPSIGFTITADLTRDGIYRTGAINGSTPALGGPVEGMGVIFRTRGSVEGTIVYAAYKVYDPQNPQNNVPDDTPNDYSDNAPVPLANFALREFEYPSRNFGTLENPITADIRGRFLINNVFTGALRLTASAAHNQEIRGTWTGTLENEGQELKIYVPIGADGYGPVNVTVVDPNTNNTPVLNAEVALFRGRDVFDFGTTDAAGRIVFQEVPIGTYSIRAFSKALGRSGGIASFSFSGFDGVQLRVSLEFSGKVRGILIDPEDGGRGVPGSHVTLSASNYQTRATTALDGTFLFDGVREGFFRLDAKATLNNRRAFATRTLSQADPEPYVELELEPTETLYARVYFPADDGSNSNVLVPVVNFDVRQRCTPGCDFFRTLQGNDFEMPQLLEREPYGITIREVGGLQRELRFSGTFPNGSSAQPLVFVLQAFGDVRITVLQAGAPAVNAKVTVSGGGKSVLVQTDGTGTAIARGLPLGPVYIQARSFDNSFSGSGSATINSQSNAAQTTIELGAYAALTGIVNAELGGPSAGTRVIALFNNRRLEVFTDAEGRYTFQGVHTGFTTSLTYMEADDSTVGARQSVNVTAGDALKTLTLPAVRLDGTPPRLLSITPEDNAQNVSPDSVLRFVFSEAIRADQLNTNYFQLIPVDSSSAVSGTFNGSTQADGTYVVTFTLPPAPAGQRFPLRSNTLYRIIVQKAVSDPTGNTMVATRGASFTTSDYAEPRVLKTVPSVTTPLQPATTFELHFNEPIHPAAWQQGGNGSIHLYKISAPGAAGTIVSETPGGPFLDAARPTILFFAPSVAIEAESFYRLTFSGVADLQGNVLEPQTLHFVSYDSTKPFIRFLSPVPDGLPLITGVEYTLKLDIRNGSADAPPATDVAKVDYFKVTNGEPVYLTTSTKAPFSYTFVGPEGSEAGTPFALQAVAHDLSLNEGAPSTIEWLVKPNKPPQNVVLTLTPADVIYAGNTLGTRVTFDDEGTFASISARVKAMRADGIEYDEAKSKEVRRNSVGDAWAFPTFDFNLPATLLEGGTATVTAKVTDVRGQEVSDQKTIVIQPDVVAPQFISSSPENNTSYQQDQQYEIATVITDLESGLAAVTFTVDGKTIVVTPADTVRFKPQTQPRTWRVTSGTITVSPKNVDTRIPIVISARDYHGNVQTRTIEVLYQGNNDPNAPKAAWVCPVPSAALPASTTTPLTLQVYAFDNITTVQFTIPGITSPISATRVGTTDIWSATANVTTPAVGEPFIILATVRDADPAHTVELSASIDLVAADFIFDDLQKAILASDVATFENKTIVMRGSGSVLTPHVPLRLRNLILLNGARVQTLETTTTTEHRVDFTVTDHLYVDCTSSIDTTARGYLGGWSMPANGSNIRNESSTGRTVGNTITGGPTRGASASHGGLGGVEAAGVTNALYDSITHPTNLGTGGSGDTTCCTFPGSNGGGAIRIVGGTGENDLARFAISGAIKADGGGAQTNKGWAGSGGSILLDAKHIILGKSARISANGGDDDALDPGARGGGGGRVSLIASERLEFEKLGTQLKATGGRNLAGDTATALDGAPGTVYLRRPEQTLGELFVGAFLETVPASKHQTRVTNIGWVGSGTSSALTSDSLTDATRTFDRLSIGEELVLAGNDAQTFTIIEVSADRKTLLTDPADGDLLAAAGSGTIAYTGLLRFDAVTVGARALLRLDDSFAIGQDVDDRTKITVEPTGAVLLRSDKPSVTVTSTPAPGAEVRQSTNISFNYTVTSPAGIASIAIQWPFATTQTTNYTNFPQSVTPSQPLTLQVPVNAAAGPATVKFTVADRAGRSITDSVVATYNVVADIVPVIDRFDVEPASLAIYPGHPVVSTVSVHDDVAVKTLKFTSKLGTAAAVVDTKSPNVPAVVNQPYTINVPIETPANTTLTLEVSADDGYAGHTPTVQSKSVTVLADTIPPQVTILEPVADQQFNEGAGQSIHVRATIVDAEMTVKTASVRIDGNTTTLTRLGSTNEYTATIPVPLVDGSAVVTRALEIIATDYNGNTQTPAPSVLIQIQPVDDANVPTLAWDCPTTNAIVPPGYSQKLRVRAAGNSPSNSIQKVELFVDAATTPLVALPVNGSPDLYEVTWIAPQAVGIKHIKAVATNYAGHTTDASIDVDVAQGTVFTTNTTISATELATENQTVIVQSGTLTIEGKHKFAKLAVLDGAKLTHAASDATTIRSFDLEVTGDVYVACSGSIDTSGRGFSGTRTWPGATASSGSAGGSHGGRGGRFDASNESGSTYGSVFEPNAPGAASANGGVGGGVVRISAASLTLDGNVLANGTASNNTPGAGGSIALRASGTIRGKGQIRADGASATTGAGGGRIALYFDTLSLDRNGITAKGGAIANDTNRSGAAGTIYFKQTAQPNGDLVVDNGTTATTRTTTLIGVGFAEATSIGSNFVTDTNAAFLAPDQLRGIRVIANGNRTTTWPIVSNDATKLTLDVTGNALAAQSGTLLRGLYRFDTIQLRNATLDSADFIEPLAPPDADASSTVIAANDGAPLLDRTKIALQSTAGGFSINGTAGAVSDPDAPITLTARNERTALQFTKTPNADGSFVIAVQGDQGDAITLRAKDSGRFPAETRPYVVGTLDSGTAAPTQIARSEWTTDTTFKPRTIAREGRFLGLTTGTASNSSTIAILDVSDSARPTLVRAFNPGVGTVRDLAISNGWAFTASDRFAAIDLNNSNTPVSLTLDFNGVERAVAVGGGYAYVAEAGYHFDGLVRVYDVSSPANIRHLRDFKIYDGADIDMTGLVLYGNDYLVAITPTHDVTVIDRRDVTNLRSIGTIEVAGFNGFRGEIAGQRLYVANNTNTEFAIFDLTNPAAPALISRTTTPQTTSGFAIAQHDLFVATNGTAVTTVDVSNPASPAINGSIPVGGAVWDVDLYSNYLYAANETGLAVVRVNVAPQIAANRISLALSGVTATITGAAQSISGAAPITVDVKNETTGSTTANVAVAAAGSFTASFAASPNDRITITARDSANRVAGPVDVGHVPFGASVTSMPLTTQTVDDAFRARRVEAEGDLLAVHSYPVTDNFGSSDDLVVYDISTPAQPVLRGRIATNLGTLWDVALQDGWAYLAGDRLGTIDLRATTPAVTLANLDFNGVERAIAVRGPYAFAAEAGYHYDGLIRIYDVSVPGSPRHMRDQKMYDGADFDFTDLVLFGDDYIVAITPFGTNDVTVIDRRNLSNMEIVARLPIPQIKGFRAVLDGTTLWVAGDDGGVAAVDLTNPAAPAYVVYNTPGVARAADAAGSTVVVADASGVTFIDPIAGITGTQAVGGSVWDVALHRGVVYAANEQGLAVISGVATAPIVNTTLITLTTDRATMATATGRAQAITGLAPLRYELKNVTSGASIADVSVQADGGFASTLPAASGDRMTLTVTDAAGRITGPVSLGQVPFGAPAAFLPTAPSQADDPYRARTLALGGNTLAMASYPSANNAGSSNRVLLFDVSNPNTPVYQRTVSMNAGALRDLAIVDHYLYGMGDAFTMLDLTNPNATVSTVRDANGSERALAVDGGYAYVAESDYHFDCMIRIYDVSVPGQPVWLRDQKIYDGSDIDFTDVLAFGSDYLIGITPSKDVTVIDRRDVNNLDDIALLNIPNFEAFRGRIDGNTLYIAGLEGGLAIVDLSNPVSPQLRLVNTQGYSRGVDSAGAMVAVADGFTGVSFVDVSGTTPRIAGVQSTGGNAWDVLMHRSALYIANETGLSVIADLATPPTVKQSLLTITTNGAGTATVTGAAQSIAGLGPLSVEVRNADSSASETAAVASNGSFTLDVAAESGDVLTLTATDGAGRTAGPIVLGEVPFGSNAVAIPITAAKSDSAFRARTLAAEGDWLAVTGHDQNNGSDKIVVFDVANGAPSYVRTLDHDAGTLRDVAISDGWVYAVGERFSITRLSDPTQTVLARDFNGSERAVAVSGGFAFVAEGDYHYDGLIRIYDVSTPRQPLWLRDQKMYDGADFDFTDLITMGDNYLIALSPTRPGGTDYDVTIVDRRDINNLVSVKRIQIPQLDAFRGHVSGTTLYVAGRDGGIAVIDLANVNAPVVKLFNTQGIARGIDVAGTLAVVADGSTGLTFVDTADPDNLTLTGAQNVFGTAWDVVLHHGTIYAANEQGLAYIEQAAVPPMIDAKRIVLTTDGTTTATITAAADAVRGLDPVSVVVRNTVTNDVSATQTVSGGTFTATVAATPGQPLELRSTDKHGRVSLRALGQVPFANLIYTSVASYTQALNDENYRSRRVATDGVRTVVSSGSTYPGVPRSDKLLVFTQTSPASAPTLVATNPGTGGIEQTVIKGDYTYTAAERLAAVNLATTPHTTTLATDFNGRENALAVVGNRLFAAEAGYHYDGMVRIYDLASPAQPQWVREQKMYDGADFDFAELVPIGADYLAAISVSKDVSILDIRNVNAISIAGNLPIANFDSFNGAVQGNTLYVVGGTKGIAVVDITNPAAPVLKSIVQTPGIARAVAISGPNEIVVADAGGPGLTFIDTSNKQQPVILGSQRLPGNATDVKAIGKTLYVAGETFFHIVNRP
ncbi:MAG TPA: Ig-like domain-containing protein [Thermoanaerobaculia bacterium]|nr:Ig-like domain-containing protein [Thermoanaerobaculia bacterium]